MVNIYIPPRWRISESEVTPESAYLNRRQFLQSVGLSGLMLSGASACGAQPEAQSSGTSIPEPAVALPLPEYQVNATYADAGRPLSDEERVTHYNNFYEFGLRKTDPVRNSATFRLDPYSLEIDGLVDKPLKLDLAEIEKLGYEERVYRFRCVEAWSMTVPWLGIPLRKLLERAGVKSEAKYVGFTSFFDPEQAQGQNNKNYPWPYYEGLRIDEAMNDLAFVATGLYGKRLLPQSGTPLRIVLPWKYGYKGPKSIVKMTLLETQPHTFWNDTNAREYGFYSNVDPQVPHPRWSQAMERDISAALKNVETQWYNGYGAEVGELYADMPRVLS